jgi:uncharacterized integral membrane protein
MATFYLILALLISIIAVIFALQNSMLVTISFFTLHTSGSLSLVLLITLAIGTLTGLLVLVPSLLRMSLYTAGQRKRISDLENEVRMQQSRKAETLSQPGTIKQSYPSDPKGAISCDS